MSATTLLQPQRIVQMLHSVFQRNTTSSSDVVPTSALQSRTESSRLLALDMVKVVAMIFMMQGHALDSTVSNTELDITTFPWIFWHYFRGFTAPIFLTVSGILFALTIKRNQDQSSKNFGRIAPATAWKRIKWALILMAVGYLMVFPAGRLIDLPYVAQEGWKFFFQVNILHLNAVALTLATLLSLSTKSDVSLGRYSLIIALVISIATPFINAFDWFSALPEFFASFLSYKHGSIFPIFPFASYLFFGIGIGMLIKEQPKQERQGFLAGGLWKPASLSFAFGAVLLVALPSSLFSGLDYLQSSPAVVFLREGFVLMMISAVAYSVTRYSAIAHKVEYWVSLFGRQSLVIYVVHLVLLYGTPWFPSVGRIFAKQLGLGTGILLALGIIITTLGIVFTEDYIKRNATAINRAMRYSIALWLMYALMI